jgi:hypothetical protein
MTAAFSRRGNACTVVAHSSGFGHLVPAGASALATAVPAAASSAQ